MNIQKPSISIKSLPKIKGPRPDFRFGPVDAVVLMIMATIAAVIYSSIASGDTLPGILAQFWVLWRLHLSCAPLLCGNP